MNNTVRKAGKAGSWYSGSKSTLSKNINGWLKSADIVVPKDCTPKALIGPHAGLAYCGETSGKAYKNVINADKIERVFIIGNTHREWINGVTVSVASLCKNPIKDLKVDVDCIKKLEETGKFSKLTIRKETQEHSLELHFPFMSTVFTNPNVKIVPLIVGDVSDYSVYADILAPYLKEDNTFFCISSDFCHWGNSFGYTYYDKTFKYIYQSIENLDKMGIEHIVNLDTSKWRDYLKKYKNTICGRNPISLLMHTVNKCNSNMKMKLTGYSQSSQVTDSYDSSVSYASLICYQ